MLKGIEIGQTHRVKIAGYFDSDGRLVTDSGDSTRSNPTATVSAERINQENARKLYEIGKSFGANSLLIAQAIGQDREGRAVLSVGSVPLHCRHFPAKVG